MGLGHKLQVLKRLLSEGDYQEILFRLSQNTIPIFSSRHHGENIYNYLHRRYRKFIENYVLPEPQITQGGGGHDDIIWWMWLQGVDEAPDVCKACLRSLRRWHPEKKIITLDKNNIKDYITFPDYIEEKYTKGIIDPVKYSNLCRLQLLIQYGGTWADSTVYCTGRHYEHLMHLPLFSFREKNYSREQEYAFSSWFIVSDPHDPILTLTRDLQLLYWQEFDYVKDYFMIFMFFNMAAEKYKDEWLKVPFVMSLPTYGLLGSVSLYEDYTEEKMKYISDIFDFHKLTHKIRPDLFRPTSILQHLIDS